MGLRAARLHSRALQLALALLSVPAEALAQAHEAEPTPDVTYAFERLDDPFPMVRVALTVTDAAARTTLRLSEHWASVRETRSAVHGVRATGADGRWLEVRESEPNTWTIEHAADERFEVSYLLVAPEQPRIPADPESFYRVLIRDDLFFMAGHVGLLRPQHLDPEEELAIRVEWRGFAEQGFTVLSSFSAEQRRFTARTTLDRFAHSLFIAGDFRHHVREIRGAPVHVAIHGTDWKFTDEAFLDLAARIVEVERDFFDDHEQPYFLISVLQVGDERSESFGGTGMTDSIGLFMSPRYGLEGADGFKVKNLLAHELFHHWNGGKIGRQEPETAVYWFSEGFTDHFARHLLLQGGLITRDEHLDSVNQALAKLFLSSVRNAPNTRIAEGFWSDSAIQDLPYQRGDVVALMLDLEIRGHSGGRESLEDVMRAILASAVREGEKVETEKLLERFARHTSDSFADHLRDVVIHGATPEIAAQMLTHLDRGREHTSLEVIDVPHFDLGFDYPASKPDNTVRGLRADSRAHEAGLRDGQKVVGWSIWHGDTTRPVTLTVRSATGTQEIRYAPHSRQTSPVPRFRIEHDDG